MRHFISLGMCLLMSIWAGQASAQIYSCKASDGKTSFQAQPCNTGEVQTEKNIATTGGNANPPGCNHPLLGRWRQTDVSTELDKDLIADASQQWTYSASGKVEHNAFIVQSIPYTCVGDIISFDAMVKNKLEIVRSTPSSMVWRSIDFGGYIYVSR